MSDANTFMADLLLDLERELRALEMWEQESPSAEHLSSSAPFAADRMAVEQWLQWIFIPRIKEIIETGATLPGACNIHPYAEECMKRNERSADALLAILLRIDQHISGTKLD